MRTGDHVSVQAGGRPRQTSMEACDTRSAVLRLWQGRATCSHSWRKNYLIIVDRGFIKYSRYLIRKVMVHGVVPQGKVLELSVPKILCFFKSLTFFVKLKKIDRLLLIDRLPFLKIVIFLYLKIN